MCIFQFFIYIRDQFFGLYIVYRSSNVLTLSSLRNAFTMFCSTLQQLPTLSMTRLKYMKMLTTQQSFNLQSANLRKFVTSGNFGFLFFMPFLFKKKFCKKMNFKNPKTSRNVKRVSSFKCLSCSF